MAGHDGRDAANQVKPRIYTAEDIKGGIRAVTRLHQQAFNWVQPAAQMMEKSPDPVETAEGHCLGCKQKRQFEVQGTAQMPNGAQRKYGTCPEADCGQTISTFVGGLERGEAS